MADFLGNVDFFSILYHQFSESLIKKEDVDGHTEHNSAPGVFDMPKILHFYLTGVLKELFFLKGVSIGWKVCTANDRFCNKI